MNALLQQQSRALVKVVVVCCGSISLKSKMFDSFRTLCFCINVVQVLGFRSAHISNFDLLKSEIAFCGSTRAANSVNFWLSSCSSSGSFTSSSSIFSCLRVQVLRKFITSSFEFRKKNLSTSAKLRVQAYIYLNICNKHYLQAIIKPWNF